jgi:Zn-dependent M16 (insulinase) family peptidase
VHHIDGEGKNAGVVYSEMQGVQNTQGDLMAYEKQHVLYPEGCGYRYETGGRLEALRVLTANRIREFHKSMYQPKNLRVCVTGNFDHAELLRVLDRFEDSILPYVPSYDAPFKRPFVESTLPPPLETTIIKRVEFPEGDESTGEVVISMFGPAPFDTLQFDAVRVIQDYLVGGSASPLNKILVEQEHLAGSINPYESIRLPRLELNFYIADVDTKNLDLVERRFFEILDSVIEQPLDMEYLRQCLRRRKRRDAFEAEHDNDYFADSIESDHLYGSRLGKDLESLIGSLDHFDALEKWTEVQWKNLASMYLTKNKHASMIGVPSSSLEKKLREDEEARLEKQQAELGEEGLKELQLKLDEFMKIKNKPIPEEFFNDFPIPGTDSIRLIQPTTAKSGLAIDETPPDNEIQMILQKDSADLPLYIHFEHLEAKFVYLSLVVSADAVPTDLKPLIPLFQKNFFETPLLRDGVRMEYDAVVKGLERDTAEYWVNTDQPLGHTELIRISFVVESEKYNAAISWLRDLICHPVYDAERLSSLINQIVLELPESRRDGSDMCRAIDQMLRYDPKTTTRAQSVLVKSLYMPQIKRMLRDAPEKVFEKLKTISKCLFTYNNFRAVVLGDIKNLPHPVSAWKTLTAGLDPITSVLPVPPQQDYFSAAGALTNVVPIPAIDSSFTLVRVAGLRGWTHPRAAAYTVAVKYLDAFDGPLQSAVRGRGLAYGANIYSNELSGLLFLSLYRAPDAGKAWEAAKKVVQDVAEGREGINATRLRAAISHLVRETASRQRSLLLAGDRSFFLQAVAGVPVDIDARLLKMQREVTAEEVVGVFKDIFMPLFDPKASCVTVTCAPAMAEVSVLSHPLDGVAADARCL